MSFGSGPRRAALITHGAEGQMGQNQTLRDFGQKIHTECQRGEKIPVLFKWYQIH